MLLLLLLLRSWWWRWQAKVLAAARSLVKGFLRRTTGLCELQRIVYGSRDGRQACLALDQSLAASRCPPVRRAVLQLLLQLSLFEDLEGDCEDEEKDRQEWAQLERACEAICAAKAVGAAQRAHLVAKGLRPCLAHMAAYQRLVLAVKRLRATPFEPQLHLELLQPLWQSTTAGDPAGPLRRPSGRWTAQCGFGSPDPVAELSGEAGALLGLLHINFLLANYDGGGGGSWSFPLASTGLQVSELVWLLLAGGHLKGHLFGSHRQLELEQVHWVFVYAMASLEQLWRHHRPRDAPEEASLLLQRLQLALVLQATTGSGLLPVRRLTAQLPQ